MSEEETPTDTKKKEQYTKLYNLLRQANASKYVAKDPVPAKIEEGLYVGSIGSTADLTALREQGITHILSVGFGLKNPHPDELEWMGVNIMDTAKADLCKHVDSCHAFIAQGISKGGVLIHCHQGKSRSVSIVATFLMKTQNLTLEQAMSKIRETRPQADPNAGFIAQLLKYQRMLKNERKGVEE